MASSKTIPLYRNIYKLLLKCYTFKKPDYVRKKMREVNFNNIFYLI